MIKKFTSLCLLLIVFLYSCDQKTNISDLDSKNDSIKKYLDLAGNDSLAFDKKIKYNDKALSFVDLSMNDSLMKRNLHVISFYYYKQCKLNKLKVTSKLLIKHSLKFNDSINLAFGYKLLGMYYMSISCNEKALDYLFKAKKIFILKNDKDSELLVLEIIAMTQSYACDFLGSNKTLFEILSKSKKLGLNRHDLYSYSLIASNLSLLKQNLEAIKYFKKVLKISNEDQSKNKLNNNIAANYIILKDYKKARFYLNLNDKKTIVFDPVSYAINNSLRGLLMIEQNDFKELPNIFFYSEKLFKKANSLNGRNYNQKYLSMYYEKIKDTTNAQIHAKEAVLLSKSYKNPDDILDCLKQLINVDKKNASKNAQEYIRINDSMQIAERLFRDKFARIAYETDEITHEKETAIKQNWIITSLAIGLILVLILVFVIYRQNTKRKELELLQSHQNENEKTYQLMLIQKTSEEEIRQNEKKRIAQELHDGVMNKLASTRLNLSILSDKNDPKTIKKCVGYIADIFKIEQEIRSITHNMNQNVFKNSNSYFKLLFDFIKEQNTVSKTRYILELNQEINWVAISSEIKINLYRIIQEASHNINKHAKAKKAIISIDIDEKNICLSITDNGIGFCPMKEKNGIGIHNIEQRVKNMNGAIIINSASNQSTAINIAIPI